MGIFNRLKEPIFLKESSAALGQLERLKGLAANLNSEGQALIKQEIRKLEYGIQGEKNIAFELKNSHMPMYILHDLYLEDGDLSAQIDYIILTRKLCFIIECKNLYGDIEINSNGDFIRTLNYNGRNKREGIYSPITQNKRHLDLLRKIKHDSSSNVITKLIIDKTFNASYKAIVVLANPKTVLNAQYAKKEVKEQVIRADQLISYIKMQCAKSKEPNSSDTEMKNWADSLLRHHKEVEKDYTEKYQRYIDAQNNQELIAVFELQQEEEKGQLSSDLCKEFENDKLDNQQPNLNCPRCGSMLIVRTARKGTNTGNQFYGCSQFPKCRYVQNIN